MVGWGAVAVVGAVCWTVLALVRGENVSALWILFAALSSYAIAYRFYSRFIAYKVLGVDNTRATPAERLQNGADYDVTAKSVEKAIGRELAVERAKPRAGATGVHVVEPGKELAFMRQLSLADIPGIGPKTALRLGERGLRTVEEVLALDVQ